MDVEVAEIRRDAEIRNQKLRETIARLTDHQDDPAVMSELAAAWSALNCQPDFENVN